MLGVAPTVSFRPEARLRVELAVVRALVISDTHFGAWTGEDILWENLALLEPHLDVDEVIFLGDLFDFLFASERDAFATAGPLFNLLREWLQGKDWSSWLATTITMSSRARCRGVSSWRFWAISQSLSEVPAGREIFCSHPRAAHARSRAGVSLPHIHICRGSLDAWSLSRHSR
jgi:hypothetical protein